MLIGAHVSTAGGLPNAIERAEERRCEAIQIFNQSPRMWRPTRYSDGDFGWSVVDPGHGLVFASTRRPQDAAAAAPLSASGTFGPLLLLPDAGVLPQPLQDFLLDIQPGYDANPVRGVYNHGWIIGDESAIAAAVQARIDTLLEIQPVDTGAP